MSQEIHDIFLIGNDINDCRFRATPSGQPWTAKSHLPGGDFAAQGYEPEVKYPIDREWAMNAQDVLWRRTRDGLRVSEEEAKYLEEYMAVIPARMAG